MMLPGGSNQEGATNRFGMVWAPNKIGHPHGSGRASSKEPSGSSGLDDVAPMTSTSINVLWPPTLAAVNAKLDPWPSSCTARDKT